MLHTHPACAWLHVQQCNRQHAPWRPTAHGVKASKALRGNQVLLLLTIHQVPGQHSKTVQRAFSTAAAWGRHGGTPQHACGTRGHVDHGACTYQVCSSSSSASKSAVLPTYALPSLSSRRLPGSAPGSLPCDARDRQTYGSVPMANQPHSTSTRCVALAMLASCMGCMQIKAPTTQVTRVLPAAHSP